MFKTEKDRQALCVQWGGEWRGWVLAPHSLCNRGCYCNVERILKPSRCRAFRLRGQCPPGKATQDQLELGAHVDFTGMLLGANRMAVRSKGCVKLLFPQMHVLKYQLY